MGRVRRSRFLLVRARLTSSGACRGPPLLKYLDDMPIVDRKNNAPLMMPISEKYTDMGTVVVGKIESGRLKKGDNVLLMPNKVRRVLPTSLVRF